MKKVLLTLQMEIEDNIFGNLNDVVNNNIEQLIDIKSWPNIKKIYGCKLDDLTNRTHLSEEK